MTTKEEKQPLSVAELEQENKKMIQQLTNKNEEYFFQLDRRMTEEGYPEADRISHLNQMLHETMELQAHSILARRHFGPVTEYMRKLRSGEVDQQKEVAEKSPLWQRYVDGALLLGSLFALVNGVMGLSSKAANYQPSGFTEIIFNFLLGGLVMLIFSKYAPKPGKKGSFLKYIAASIGAMLLWVIGVTLLKYVAVKYPVLNPLLPNWAVILIGSTGFAARYLFKRHYNVKGTLF